MKLLLATKNRDKVKEMRAVLNGLEFELLSAADLPELPDVVEDAPTLEGNAVKKAKTLFEITGIPSIADDTGLEVEALNGAPGVFSSRYSGPNATYADNVRKLLQETANVPRVKRAAQFRTVVAFVTEAGTETVEGICAGEIIFEPRGENGFGYDPVFEVAGTGKTLAEMALAEKNKISHRGKALQKLAVLIREKASI
ncbi:MAG: RdgB/HAM1 family non-canonical purine NTP pyrophosphatase [bacterium]